jgi:hypothetical protein
VVEACENGATNISRSLLREPGVETTMMRCTTLEVVADGRDRREMIRAQDNKVVVNKVVANNTVVANKAVVLDVAEELVVAIDIVVAYFMDI